MPFKPGAKGDAAVESDFVDDSFGVATGPAVTAVRAQSKTGNAERVYTGLPRMWKVTNLAKQGALKNKGWFASFNGAHYPDGVDPEDEATYLQPGESMIVDREVMISIAGDILNPNLPDKNDIIAKYGGWEYDVQPTQDGKVAGRIPVMTIIGPPLQMPDLLIEPIDLRGKASAYKRNLIDTYCKNQPYSKPQMQTVEDSDGAKHAERRKDLLTI